jgi:hypothetical protein
MRKIIEQGVVTLDGDDDIETTHLKLRKTDGLENGVVGLAYPLR